MTAYYNENDPVAAAVLRDLAAANIIAPGHVDSRSIKDVTADDLKGFTQCHFFAGAGLWSVATRLAGWPDERPLWSASCPCQPLSNAGKRLGALDPRHLWPDLFRIIRGARAGGFGPPVILGEQVSGKAGYHWFDGVGADLETEGYASRARDIPACAVDAPHERNRLWWIAVADAEGRDGGAGLCEGREEFNGPLAANGDGGDLLLADAEGERGRRELAQRRSSKRAAHRRPDARGDVEHAESERRREGSPEAGVLGRRPTAPGTDLRERRDSDVGHALGAGLQGLGGDELGGRATGRRPDRDSRAGEAAPACRPVAAANGGDRERNVDDADSGGRPGLGEPQRAGIEGTQGDEPLGPDSHRLIYRPNGSWWSDAEWIKCHDGKARRTKPGLCLLVNGMAGRIDLWRVAGNSIVPVLAAEVIGALLDAEKEVTPG